MAGCVGRKLSVVKDENYHCVGERWRGARHILQGGGDEGDEKEDIEWLGVKY